MDPRMGCPAPLGWETACVWTCCTYIHLCIRACTGKCAGETSGRAGCTGQVRIIFCGRSELALGQDRANSESIKPAGVMHTEGRLHPRCAERALTAHTLSGFFIGTQATAQSSALNTTNGKRGNGTFICLSSSGGLLPLLLLLTMHWNTGPPHSLGSITNINISQDEAHAIGQKLHCILSWGCGT